MDPINAAFLICSAWMLPMCSTPPTYFSLTPPYYAQVEPYVPSPHLIVPYGPAATMSMRSRHDIAIHSIRNTR